MPKKKVTINDDAKLLTHDEIGVEKTSVGCAVDGCRKQADYKIAVTDQNDRKNKFNTGLCYDHEDSMFWYFHFGTDKYPNRKHLEIAD